jgi:hypothetical protein
VDCWKESLLQQSWTSARETIGKTAQKTIFWGDRPPLLMSRNRNSSSSIVRPCHRGERTPAGYLRCRAYGGGPAPEQRVRIPLSRVRGAITGPDRGQSRIAKRDHAARIT